MKTVLICVAFVLVILVVPFVAAMLTSPWAGCTREHYEPAGETLGVTWIRRVCDEYAPWAKYKESWR